MQPQGSLVDRFSGMVTRQRADQFLSEGRQFGINSAQDIAEIIKINAEDDSQQPAITSVQDKVYRVFNQKQEKSIRGMAVRDIVLGDSLSGQTILAIMYGSASDLADSMPIERGDEILLNNVLLDFKAGAVKSIAKTSISIIKKSASASALARLDSLQGNERNIDIAGKVLETGPLKYRSNSLQFQNAESYCIITDFTKNINVHASGSAALALAGMKPGDFIKIEFCSSLLAYNDVVIAANNNSRIFSNPCIAERLKG